MNSLKDTFRLRNGVGIPCVGFGTYLTKDGRTAVDAVLYALQTGYRHIDTAAVYGNESSIGKAVAQSGIPREEVFVTSKLWTSEFGYDKALRAFDKSLSALGMDYLDLYLIHWPANDEEGALTNADTWRALEHLHAEKRVRAIGVSNFKAHHLASLMERSAVVPAVNQIEYHPGQPQRETVDFCRANDIIVEAWGPLGRGLMLRSPQLNEIADRYGVSAARLCIRWCLQNGVVPLPKSVTPARIEENADVFGFAISDEDMDAINEMPYFGGSGHDPDTHKF